MTLFSPEITAEEKIPGARERRAVLNNALNKMDQAINALGVFVVMDDTPVSRYLDSFQAPTTSTTPYSTTIIEGSNRRFDLSAPQTLDTSRSNSTPHLTPGQFQGELVVNPPAPALYASEDDKAAQARAALKDLF